MASANDVRQRNRTVVVHPDGTAYQIRKLRQIDFVAKNMMLIAARGDEKTDTKQLIEQYIREHPDEVLDGINVDIISRGVTGLADLGPDGRVGQVHPLRIVQQPTEAEGELYYLDLGPHFQWLVEQIKDFSGLTEEAATQQDSFPESPRPDAVPAQ